MPACPVGRLVSEKLIYKRKLPASPAGGPSGEIGLKRKFWGSPLGLGGL